MCNIVVHFLFVFFFQAEDGIRDGTVTGVQTCALPIYDAATHAAARRAWRHRSRVFPDRTSTEPLYRSAPSPRAVRAPARRGRRSEERRVGKEWRCRWSRDQ